MKHAFSKVVPILAGILLTTLLISMAGAAFFPDCNETEGITSDDVYAINYVSDNEIMVGNGIGFNPNGQMTRGEVVVMLYAFSGETGSYTNPFEDVHGNDYFYNAVGWAYQNGITSGTSSTTFSPLNIVDRQQFCCFLYAYATSYLGYSFDRTALISSYSDYNSVYVFARTAVSWAVAYHILIPDNGQLFPRNSLLRKNAALFLCRYNARVEAMTPNEDIYSFVNTKSNFVTSGYPNSYYVSTEDYQKVCDMITAGSANSAMANVNLSRFTSSVNTTWGGSCHGMATTAVLDLMGILAVNENWDSNAGCLYATTSPRTNIPLRSLINVYQTTYGVSFLNTTTNYYYGTTFSAGLQALTESLRQDNIILFSYWWGASGHSIVLYDYQEIPNGGIVAFAYDNRYPSSVVTVSISSDFATCTVLANGRYEQVTSVQFEDNFGKYQKLDMDGLYNDFIDHTSSNSNSIGNAIDEDNYSELQVVVSGDFIIQNSEGETLACRNGVFDGDMEIKQINAFAETTANGKSYSTYLIVVPSSEQFIITGDGEKNISLASHGLFFNGISKADSMSIDTAAGTVSFNGVNYDADVRIGVPYASTYLIGARANNVQDGLISFTYKDDCLIAEGNSSTIRIVKYAKSDGRPVALSEGTLEGIFKYDFSEIKEDK